MSERIDSSIQIGLLLILDHVFALPRFVCNILSRLEHEQIVMRSLFDRDDTRMNTMLQLSIYSFFLITE